MYFLKTVKSECGFTLAELMVAMVISGIVMTGIYSTFYSQNKTYLVQDQIASMQQNIRAAVQCLESEIRMAGFNPTGSAEAGILTAAANSIRFTMDVTDDTGTGPPDGDISQADEDITYSLDAANNLLKNGAGNILAENIDAINFVYLDRTGAVTADLTAIRSVQISLVARTNRTDPGYTDNNTYLNQQGTTILAAPNDNFRRRLITTEVHCRNLEF